MGRLHFLVFLSINGSLISLGLLDSLGALLVSGFLFSDGSLSSLGLLDSLGSLSHYGFLFTYSSLSEYGFLSLYCCTLRSLGFLPSPDTLKPDGFLT